MRRRHVRDARGTSRSCVAADLRPGMHLSMLGADAAGKAEAEPGAVAECVLFCDEWEQASHGGELTERDRRRAHRARPT